MSIDSDSKIVFTNAAEKGLRTLVDQFLAGGEGPNLKSAQDLLDDLKATIQQINNSDVGQLAEHLGDGIKFMHLMRFTSIMIIFKKNPDHTLIVSLMPSWLGGVF